MQTTIQAQLCLHPAPTVTPSHFTGSGDSQEPATADSGIWEGDGRVWGDSRFCAVRRGSRQRLALRLKRLPVATPEVTSSQGSRRTLTHLERAFALQASHGEWGTMLSHGKRVVRADTRHLPLLNPNREGTEPPWAARPGVPIPEGSDLASARSQTPTGPLAVSGCLASPEGRPGLCPHFNQFGKRVEQLLHTWCIRFLLPLYQITTTSCF